MNIEGLIKRHREFREVEFKKHKDLFLELVKKGQRPKTLFIGCSDSRVIPTLITGAGPGDLFVLRVVGNFVPPFEPDDDYHAAASAIEYAVTVLKVENIIVCGHSHCGACESLYKKLPEGEELIHTRKWLELGKPAKDAALRECPESGKEELLRLTERYSVLVQLENLLTYPAVKRGVDENRIYLHGWYYRIEDGEIEYYDSTKKAFLPLT